MIIEIFCISQRLKVENINTNPYSIHFRKVAPFFIRSVFHRIDMVQLNREYLNDRDDLNDRY